MASQVDDRLRKLADASSEPILAVHVEPTEDMDAERARASFDTEELAIELNGSRALLEKKCVSRLIGWLHALFGQGDTY